MLRVDQLTVPADRTRTDTGRRGHGRRLLVHRPRRPRFRYTLSGLAGAVLFLCWSLFPSLLPRTGLTQGLISGITAAFGYAVGTVAANVWDAFAGREAVLGAYRHAVAGQYRFFSYGDAMFVLPAPGAHR